MEGTENGERRKQKQSKSEFGNPRFDTFCWRELCPTRRFLVAFNEGLIQCVR
jgi:hypothetical protein